MAVMAKWRNKTFEVSRKKVNPLKNFSTSTTIKGDDSKSKKKKTELVPFTFDIDVHANAGVNPQKEYESWCSLIKSTGVLYLHGRRFGRETRLKEVSLSLIHIYTEYIAGLRLVKENNIEYGPFTEDGALVSYYPYWFCWVQFTLEHGLARKIPADYEKLL